jgi:hypothetical protein
MNLFSDEQPRLTLLTVVVASASVILFELVQTRILSFIFWNHVVYLVIALALLGLGVSGSLVTALQARDRGPVEAMLGVLLGMMAVGIVASVLVTGPGLHMFRAQPHAFRLLLAYAGSLPPFICGGAVLALLLQASRITPHRIYHTDLVAAGGACIAFFIALPLMGAVNALLAIAAVLGAVAYGWLRRAGRGRVWLALPSVIAAIGGAAAWRSPEALDPTPERYKEMGELLRAGAVVEHTVWTPIARLDVLGGLANPLGYVTHPPGSYKILTQDGSAHTRIIGKAAVDALFAARAGGVLTHASALPFVVMTRPDVLLVGTGGGIDVAQALAHGARAITAVELNPYTHHIVRDRYGWFSERLLERAGVRSLTAEGRAALRELSEDYDLVQVIAIDTFAALNAGAYVLSENYLYTVEAFGEFISRLRPEGILSVYRWNAVPPRESLRLVSLAAEAWRRRGVDRIGDRVMAVGSANWALCLFKASPFTEQEVNAIEVAARGMGETVFYRPSFGTSGAPTPSPGDLGVISQSFRGLVEAYDHGGERGFFADYPFNVSPTFDDSPFFFESIPLLRSSNWTLDQLRGTGVQAALAAIALLATVVLVLAVMVPLLLNHRDGLFVRAPGAHAVYFASLGVGFMLIEIGMMQKSTLLLGNPMYSIPVLLAAILVGGGVGSRTSSRWTGPMGQRVQLAWVALLLACVGGALAVEWLEQLVGARTLWVRATAVVLALLPVGFALGLFFPMGLDHVKRDAPRFLPWAWGINGAASVYGSLLAVVLGMWRGFTAVLVIGVGVYLLAVASARQMARSAGSGSTSESSDGSALLIPAGPP